MATVPTITTNTSPVTIQSSGSTAVTYNQILSQLGTYNFKVNKLSLIATKVSDLYVNLSVQRIDANGNVTNVNVPIIPSQYQRITQVDSDLSSDKIVFDSRTFLNFTVTPNSSLTLLFDTTQWSNTGLL